MNTQRIISSEEAQQVFKLFNLLDTFTGEYTNIFRKIRKNEQQVATHALYKKIHDKWAHYPELITQFLIGYGSQLTQEEKDIVTGWKTAIEGTFLCVAYEPDYAVMMPLRGKGNYNYYAVKALNGDFAEMITQQPPYLIKTILLPYKDTIIWDGLILLSEEEITASDTQQLITLFCETYDKNKNIVHTTLSFNK